MATKTAKQDDAAILDIVEIEMQEATFNIVGASPLVPHAMSAKARGELLMPARKKNATERETTLKHDPYQEFIDAAYKFTDHDQQPTRLYMPTGAFHGAMANAAIDSVGARKAQIGRLTTVIGNKVPIYGVPKMWMAVVRSSDMKRTPDVRTLPLLEEWCCTITIKYVSSLIKLQSIANLLGTAGVIIGVGDGRPEKGKFSMGQFQIVSEDDPDFLRIKANGGLAAQDAGLKNPAKYDLETEELFSWFIEEQQRRVAAPAKEPRKARKGGDDAVIAAAQKNGGDRPHKV